MFRIKYFVPFLVIVLSFSKEGLLAQNPGKELDSLRLLLKNAKHDTTRCNILSAMIDYEPDDHKWPAINEELMKVAGAGLTQNDLSEITRKEFKGHLAAAFSNKGYITNKKGNVEKAFEYYEKSIRLIEEVGDLSGLAVMLNNVGFMYKRQGDLVAAQKYYERSVEIQLNTQKTNGKVVDKKGLAGTLTNLGSIMMEEGKSDKALEYFDKVLRIAEEEQYNEVLAPTINNIGTIHIKRKEYDLALKCFERASDLWIKIKSTSGLASTYNNISSVYLIKGQYLPAIKYANLAMATGSKTGFPANIVGAAERLSILYKKTGDHKKSLENYELYIQMRDSVNNESTRKAGIKNQLKYEYEKQAVADSVAHAKESEIKNVELQRQSAEIRAKKNQQYALFGGLGLVIIFAGFMFNRFRVTQKQKIIIEHQKEIVEEQKHLVEEKQKEVFESIRYAKRIQMAQIPSEKMVNKILERIKIK